MLSDMLKFLLGEYCKEKTYKLTEHADAVIAGIIKKDGHCPCKLSSVPCPCPEHEKEIEEKGHCHAYLVARKPVPLGMGGIATSFLLDNPLSI